ncbi:MAG: hypothetical protein M3247_04915, partial [Thermoproteota archaeon]|nr:hypothetical protein [Thermoproteota archaeon]
PYYDINVTNELEPGSDVDGIDDSHPVFCGIYPCGETIIKGWDSGLCIAYYSWGLITADCRIDTGDNHGGYIGFRHNSANRNICEYDGAMDLVVQHWLKALN